MPLPQRGPYEASEGIYPGRAGNNWEDENLETGEQGKPAEWSEVQIHLSPTAGQRQENLKTALQRRYNEIKIGGSDESPEVIDP